MSYQNAFGYHGDNKGTYHNESSKLHTQSPDSITMSPKGKMHAHVLTSTHINYITTHTLQQPQLLSKNNNHTQEPIVQE